MAAERTPASTARIRTWIEPGENTLDDDLVLEVTLDTVPTGALVTYALGETGFKSLDVVGTIGYVAGEALSMRAVSAATDGLFRANWTIALEDNA